jgi:hypothetical protein
VRARIVNVVLGLVVAAALGGLALLLLNRTTTPTEPEPRELQVVESSTRAHLTSTVQGASSDCPSRPLTTKGHVVKSDSDVTIAAGKLTIGEGGTAYTGAIDQTGTFDVRNFDGTNTLRGRITGKKGSGGSILVLPGKKAGTKCTVGMTFAMTLDEPLF